MILTNLMNRVSKSLSWQADCNRSCRMGIPVGIWPIINKLWNKSKTSPVSRTWQGHLEWLSLKSCTQEFSQLLSSSHSSIHWPRVLLVFVKQTSKLSTLISSFNKKILPFIGNLNLLAYIAETNWIFTSLATINAISMTWTR